MTGQSQPADVVSSGLQQFAGGALEIDSVEMRYGNLKVLKGISFEVPAGEAVCVIGPSGSGSRQRCGASTASPSRAAEISGSMGCRPCRCQLICSDSE